MFINLKTKKIKKFKYFKLKNVYKLNLKKNN